MIGNDQADRVDAVSSTANGHGNSDTNPIDNSAGYETDDSEARVESNIL